MIVNAFTHHIGKVEGANLVAHPKSTPTPASQPPTLYYLEPIPMEKTCPTHKVTDFGAISGTTSSDRTWASLCLGLVQGVFRVACTYYSHLFRGGGGGTKPGRNCVSTRMQGDGSVTKMSGIMEVAKWLCIMLLVGFDLPWV